MPPGKPNLTRRNGDTTASVPARGGVGSSSSGSNTASHSTTPRAPKRGARKRGRDVPDTAISTAVAHAEGDDDHRSSSNAVPELNSATGTPAGRATMHELPSATSLLADENGANDERNVVTAEEEDAVMGEEDERGLVRSVASSSLQDCADAGNVNDNEAVAQLVLHTRIAAQLIRDHLEISVNRFKVTDAQIGQLLASRQEVQPRVDQVVQSRQPEAYADVVTLNVGGEKFTVPLATLLGKDSPNYFHVLLGSDDIDCVVPVFKDADRIVFIDRDPACFRYVLDYLRGYHYFNLLKEDALRRLKVDATYFQLPGLLAMLGELDREAELQFNVGPGVSPERNRLRVVYGVAVVGDVSLVTGRHTITYEVKVADYIGFGLVSEACVNTDQEFHKIPDCCVYYMSGVFYTNYPYHRKEENLERIENGDFITVKVDLEKGYVEYVLKNSRKMVSLGRARRLRFATTMKLASRVRIVPPEEVRRRLPSVHYSFDE